MDIGLRGSVAGENIEPGPGNQLHRTFDGAQGEDMSRSVRAVQDTVHTITRQGLEGWRFGAQEPRYRGLQG